MVSPEQHRALQDLLGPVSWRLVGEFVLKLDDVGVIENVLLQLGSRGIHPYRVNRRLGDIVLPDGWMEKLNLS